MKVQNYHLIVSGVVQGVGFRPFVYNLATHLKLKGTIQNHAHCVVITLYHLSLSTLKHFIALLKNNAPKNAKITTITYKSFADSHLAKDFRIIHTNNTSTHAQNLSLQIPKDYAICQECLKDFSNPTRFHSYAFTACTQCGARYSMLYSLPYERVNTAMRDFMMCAQCQKDYENPLDRRFHAQPISCNHCAIEFSFNGVKTNALQACINALKNDKIVAIKGIGGFALVTKADNTQNIAQLRARKNRPHKPFAIVCKDLAQVRQIAKCTKKEEQALQSKQSPIVLLTKKKRLDTNAVLNQECLDLIAPNIDTIGILLPFSGILHLLFTFLDSPLIFTSANANGSPIATNTQELQQFCSAFDCVLTYNRAIVNGIDDSVVRLIGGNVRILRSARGYAPLALKSTFKPKAPQAQILTLGANQKASFSLSDGTHTLTSHYIGDLNNLHTLARYRHTLANILALYRFTPQIFVCDMHPQYATSVLVKELARKTKNTLDSTISTNSHSLQITQCEFVKKQDNHFAIQHHYAHFCAILGENGKYDKKQYLGIIWDGTGFGVDSHIWGGEAFVGNLHSAKRVASLQEFRLLGGENAIKDIRRLSLALILAFAPTHRDIIVPHFNAQELTLLEQMYEKNLNSIATSSVGRLFSAVAHILGIAERESYEGQCGAMLESYYDNNEYGLYPVCLADELRIDIAPLISGICADKKSHLKTTNIVSKFFNSLAQIALLIAQKHKSRIDTNEIFFSGGVFANKVLCERIAKIYKQNGFRAIFATKYPSGDECISLGQALAIIARIKQDTKIKADLKKT